MLLASEIISETFLKVGYEVKMSAAYGMAQRGGSILSHIRIGKKIYSPVIPKGEADILVAMELIEAARGMDFLKKDGLIMLLNQQIFPNAITLGVHRYPRNLKEKMKKRCKTLLEISCEETARALRSIKTVNIFILGVLSNYFSVKKKYWCKTIREKIPSQMINLNLAAFELGRHK